MPSSHCSVQDFQLAAVKEPSFQPPSAKYDEMKYFVAFFLVMATMGVISAGPDCLDCWAGRPCYFGFGCFKEKCASDENKCSAECGECVADCSAFHLCLDCYDKCAE